MSRLSSESGNDRETARRPAKPSRVSGMETPRMCHVALEVADLAACEIFYRDVLGLRVVWRPDADTIHLSSGGDDLALHRSREVEPRGAGRLDHFGFVVPDAQSVDQWFTYLSAIGVRIVAVPRAHRDGARSFYCTDPDGNTVQILSESR
jgi:catechol 2,3-dioxygenase-like lactoylglutathione lyase family enzyme